MITKYLRGLLLVSVVLLPASALGAPVVSDQIPGKQAMAKPGSALEPIIVAESAYLKRYHKRIREKSRRWRAQRESRGGEQAIRERTMRNTLEVMQWFTPGPKGLGKVLRRSKK